MIFRLPISRINRPGYFAGKKRGRRKEVGREAGREGREGEIQAQRGFGNNEHHRVSES